MRVELSPEAAGLVRERGGQLWVWAARPPVCCWGTPAYMHAATERPRALSGFSLVSRADVEVWFRAPSGRVPEVLEIGLRGRRKPRVEAYWMAASSHSDSWLMMRMVTGVGTALTGRIGRHSTAGLAVVAAADLMVTELDEGVRRGHPQLGGERRVVRHPV